MAPDTLRYLSRDTLENLDLKIEEVVESIEHLLRGCRQSRAWNAPKAVIAPPDGRYMMATLAAADDPPYLAVKSLLLNPRNPRRGLSTINALVVLLDSDTGMPLAVMDGNWITAMRTAGLSAVAARRLARPDSSVAAFIGCGVQAQSHLRALAALFPLQEVRAFGRGSANRDALCRSAEGMGFAAVASATARDALSDADLVVSSVTLTPRPEPFLDARWLKPGVFATITDAGVPWVTEGMSAFDRIVVDDIGQESAMAQPMVPPEMVAGDLMGLVNGDTPQRSGDGERTAFVFRGLALGDLALAGLAYRRVCETASGSIAKTGTTAAVSPGVGLDAVELPADTHAARVNFEELMSAYEFVSAAPYGEHGAVLLKNSGRILWRSEMGDIDELADAGDADGPDAVSLPHKNDLNMGRELVFDFIKARAHGDHDRVRQMFKKRGAYSRFKDLLDQRGLLQAWYDFEAAKQAEALRQWCAENGIAVTG